MYKSMSWAPNSQLTSTSMNQMVENDKDNYLMCANSSGPIVAMSLMTNRFESMPGNVPTRIPELGIDAFIAPYTGWYKAHFSCPSARQDTTNIDGGSVSQVTGVPTTYRANLIYLDGFYFVITSRHSRSLPFNATYNPASNESLFDVAQERNSPALASVIARATFAGSGYSVPVAATGYKWLNKGDSVAWDVYTYVANNNYDLLSTSDRFYGRIVMNARSASSTTMGYGSPRLYSYNSNSTPTLDAFTDNPTTPSTNDYKTISNLIAPNDDTNRTSYLMVQFAGQGGVPGVTAENLLEKELNAEVLYGEQGIAYEV
jgi:hypothetical protein